MSDAVLVLNAGSSSVKFTLFARTQAPSRADALCEGQCDGIGARARFTVHDARGQALVSEDMADATTHEQALAAVLHWLARRFPDVALAAAGHRVVHGGAFYAGPVRIDADVAAQLARLIPLAPLHQPHNLAAIAALAKLHPGLPQFACFDTAFHRTQPRLATLFALPRALTEEGVRRYGFHGLSYEYIAGVLPAIVGAETAAGRVVVAHLGNGASMCAMRAGKSVATTMGFTALDGLVMGQRCGALDPGVVLYLLDEKGMTSAQIARLLYHDSGLIGVSGLSNDMRALLASADPHAKEAIDLFVYRIGHELGALAAALGGIDALVFTAGIGEHAAEIRARVIEDARWLGFELDGAANAAGEARISGQGSRASAWVIATDEDLVIARHTVGLLRQEARAH